MSWHDGTEGVHRRRFYFCGWLTSHYDLHDLFLECHICKRFFVRCCQHGSRQHASGSGVVRRRDGSSCHHWPVVYTDGACPGNGTSTARGGIGFALGSSQSDQVGISLDSERCGFGLATSQRMELCAAIAALQDFKNRWLEGPDIAVGRDAGTVGDVELVVAMDSEYVVNGITELFPIWSNNGWKTRRGKIPANLGLFKILDTAVSQVEALGVAVGFIHIPREINTLADSLARGGANRALIQEF